MKDIIRENREQFKKLLDEVAATDLEGVSISVDGALEKTIHLIQKQSEAGGKIIFIGNGGSAAIASHMATDFWKNGGIKAIAFNDSVLLTCLSNDYGYPHVFEKSLEMFAEKNDLLIAISSSGKSENILRAVSAAQEKGLSIVTFSGFKEDNPLRLKGEINFYVPSMNYGHVEVVHHALCHSLIDAIIKNKTNSSKKVSYEQI